MTDEPITSESAGTPETDLNDVIHSLFGKLDTLDLEEAEKDLLVAILKVAADIRDQQEATSSFSEQFAASFKRTNAERVMAYAQALVTNGAENNIHKTAHTTPATVHIIHR